MGIYDRDYTHVDRAPGRGRGSLFRGHSTVAIIIGINAAVFILWHVVNRATATQAMNFHLLDSNQSFMWKHFTVSASGVLEHFRLHTLFTSEFSHIEPWHLFWNMLFLWWLGSDLEELYGSRDFMALYLFAGGAASIVHVGAGLTLSADIPALGASGSVMGIVIVCACFFPDRPLLLMGIIPIKLKWLAIFYVVSDLIPVIDGKETGVAHAAHLGGALAGFLYYKFDLRLFSMESTPGTRWSRLGRSLFGWLRRPAAPGVHKKPQAASSFQSQVDPQTAERIDKLLKKISSEGIGALTEEEHAFLKTSSAKYKQSRPGRA